MEKMYFVKKPPFVNRQKETEYFLDYFNSSPTNILFVYGPKSTGKTTLINRVIEALPAKEYDINYINLRSVLMTDFKDFRNLFFPRDLRGKTKDLLGSIGEIGAFGFSWNPGEEHIAETNIFGLMEDKLRKLNKAGIKPVIVLDEFQYLKNIFVDNTKEIRLIDELFKFFISITKQFNLAHVVCLTSDSYYMEELYNHTKLSNTSRFYLIEHLSQKDIEYWLGEKENCPEKMISDVWENLGGSVWEIWQVLVSYKNTGDYTETLNDLLQVKYSLVAEWYYSQFVFKLGEINTTKGSTFLNVLQKIIENGKHVPQAGDHYITELIQELVAKDIWFYDTKYRTITANSKSFEEAFARLLAEI